MSKFFIFIWSCSIIYEIFVVQVIGGDLDEVRKEHQTLRGKIKQLEEELRAIDNDINSLQEELTAVSEKRDKAFESLQQLRKQRDEGVWYFHSHLYFIHPIIASSYSK